MDPAFRPLLPADTFRFACHPQVPCFNQCCRDLTQHLTPYDILRLKQALGLSSGELLSQYILESTGPSSGLPIISLRPVGPERLCPFVADDGCRVYLDRPASCRTYPLARAVGIHPQSGELVEQFALLREPHCRGFATERKQAAAEWVADQGLSPYNQMNDRLLELIQLNNRRAGGPLTPTESAHFRLALYDLDEFRSRLTAGELPDAGLPAAAIRTALDGDADDLLQFALRWTRRIIFERPL